MWMPFAKIDKGAEGSEGEGTPVAYPRHSGTVWSAYLVTDLLRLGAGVNFRSRQQPNRNPGWYAPGLRDDGPDGRYLMPSGRS